MVVDAVFGFSFKGPVRGVFKEVFEIINATNVPIVSVDIPSGWDVEKGYVNDGIKNPTVIISLSAPKMGVKGFKGVHYLGGRFIPLELKKDLNLMLNYAGEEMIVRL